MTPGGPHLVETGTGDAGERVRVTVIIPAFNAEATITETLQSVSSQTYKQLEIIVVDDGSTDRTADLIRAHGRQDPRLRLLQQRNRGVAVARNAGLMIARGEYIACIDADDLWLPTKIEKQLAVFEAATSPLAFVYTGYRVIDENDRILRNHRTLTDVSGQTLCRQLATNFFSNVSSLMAPAQLVRYWGGYETRLRAWGIEGAEDFLMQLRLATLGPVGCCREALVGYRMHAKNMSRAIDKAAESNLRAIALIAEEEPSIPVWVLRLGRARTVGFDLQMIAKGSVGDGLRLLANRLREDIVETLRMLGQSTWWFVYDAAGLRQPDPALGDHFRDADPTTAPWEGHMLLTDRQRRRLDRIDAEITNAEQGDYATCDHATPKT